MKNKTLAILTALSLIASGVVATLAPIAQAQVVTAQVDPRAVGSTVDLAINNDGSVSLDGAYVQQIAGSTFYTQIFWGDAFLRILLLTNANTVFTKKYGGSISGSQISVGDFLSVTGTLNTSTGSLNVTGATVKDWSIQTQADQFSGTVTGLATSSAGFFLKQASGATIQVGFGTTSQIIKGSLVLSPSQINVGDKITMATGVYDHVSNKLTAASLTVYEDMSIFQPKNFQGTLVSLGGTTLPTTMVINVNGQQYTVKVSAATSVLNDLRQTIQIARYLPGDTIRVYGSIEEANHYMIDSQVVRNISL